jgi:hypothetical protein
VGVAAKEGIGSGGQNPFQGNERTGVGQQIFVLAMGAAVNEAQIVLLQRQGQFSQIIAGFEGDGLVGPFMGQPTPSFRQQGGIATVAGIQPVNDVFIPTALAGGNVEFANAGHHFVGIGAVAHQVTEAVDLVHGLLVNVPQNGL